MLYNTVLVSAKHQHESAIGIHTYVPSLLNLPAPPSPSHSARLSQSPGLSFLSHTANSHWLSTLHMVIYIFRCYSLHTSYPLLLSLPSTLPLSPPPTTAFLSLFSMSVSLDEIRPFLQMLRGSSLASSPPVGLLHARIIAPSA